MMKQDLRWFSLCATFSWCLASPVYADLTILPGDTLNNADTIDNYDYLDNYGSLENFGTILTHTVYPETPAQLNNWGSIDNYSVMTFGDPYDSTTSTSLNNYADITNWSGASIELASGASVYNAGTFTNFGDIGNTYYSYSDPQPVFINSGTLDNHAGIHTDINNNGTLNNDGGIDANNLINQVSGVINNYVSGFMTVTQQLLNNGIMNNDGNVTLSDGSTSINTGQLNNTGYLNMGSYTGSGVASLTNSGSISNSGEVHIGSDFVLNNNGDMLNSGSYFADGGFVINNNGTITNDGYFSGYSSNPETLNNNGTFINHSNIDMQSLVINNTGTLQSESYLAGLSLKTLNLAAGSTFNNLESYTSVLQLNNSSTFDNKGLIMIRDQGQLNNYGTLNNTQYGGLEIGSYVTLNNYGSFNQSGSFNNSGDYFSFNNYGNYTESMYTYSTMNLRNYSSLNNYGTFNGYSTIDGSGSSDIINSGTFNSAGMIQNMYLVRNSGSMTLSQGLSTETLDNKAGGSIQNSYYSNLTTNVLKNKGTINNQNTASITVNQDFSNSGSIRNATNARITLNGLSNLNTGTIKNDGLMEGFSDFTSSGKLMGNGTYNFPNLIITEAGTLAPGNSVGTMTIGGNLNLDGTLAMEFDWSSYPQIHDQLNVSGVVSLGSHSILDLSFLGGDYFSLGDSYDLLSAYDISGNFASFSYDPLLDPSLALEWSIYNDYGMDILRVTVVSAVPLPAAAWLFISGLLGLFAASRKRRLH